MVPRRTCWVVFEQTRLKHMEKMFFETHLILFGFPNIFLFSLLLLAKNDLLVVESTQGWLLSETIWRKSDLNSFLVIFWLFLWTNF